LRHWLVDDWAINEQTGYINCGELYNWVKYKKINPEKILISDIGYRSLKDIDQSEGRYINANISLPCLVVKGMKNPYNKPYRMIDGRHRLLKSINKNIIEIRAYVLEPKQALKFITYA